MNVKLVEESLLLAVNKNVVDMLACCMDKRWGIERAQDEHSKQSSGYECIVALVESCDFKDGAGLRAPSLGSRNATLA
jgi:hypothetical protein